jgi:hypothetical protein
LAVEALEDRLLMAADFDGGELDPDRPAGLVSFIRDEDTLQVIGGDGHQGIRFVPGPQAGVLRVEILDSSSVLHVAGQGYVSDTFIDFTGITDIEINFGDGPDAIAFQGVTIPGDLRIQGGIYVLGMGLTFDQTNVVGELEIHNDIEYLNAYQSTFYGEVSIDPNGTDTGLIMLDSSFFWQSLSIENTNGIGQIVDGGAILLYTYNSHFFDDVAIEGDTSFLFTTANAFVLEHSRFHGNVLLDAGDFDDAVTILDCVFYNEVEIDQLDDGDDTVSAIRTVFHADFDIGGGSGDDIFINSNTNTFNGELGLADIIEVPRTRTTGIGLEPRPDSSGPQVIRSIAGRDHLRVTFDEPIDLASFTRGDVAIVGSNSMALVVTGVVAVPGSGNHSFDILFRPAASGGYRATIGPAINDLAGNPMNQDGDTLNGEATQDRYVYQDFSGPRILSATPGWQHIRVSFNEAIDPRTFTTADVTFTDKKGNAVPLVSVSEVSGTSGKQFDIVVKSLPFGGYNLTIGPNLNDLRGNLMNQDNDAINGEAKQDRYKAKPRDGTGPTVLGIVQTRFDRGIVVEFSEAINPTTLTLADVTIVATATNQVVPVTRIVAIPSGELTRFELRFAANLGDYELTLGPNVNDLFGNPMAAAYTAPFSIDLQPPPQELPVDPELLVQLELLMADLPPLDPKLDAEALEAWMTRYEERMETILPPAVFDPDQHADFDSPLLGKFAIEELIMASRYTSGAKTLLAGALMQGESDESFLKDAFRWGSDKG